MGYSETMSERSSGSVAMSSVRVAIVEDSAIIRKRLVELVEDIGGMDVVGEASTEKAAIRVCRESHPSVVILDMQLELGNGLGVLRTMQYGPSGAKPAARYEDGVEFAHTQGLVGLIKPTIIVLTNFPSPSVERAAKLLGADAFLDKSKEFHKLRPLLQAAAEAQAA